MDGGTERARTYAVRAGWGQAGSGLRGATRPVWGGVCARDADELCAQWRRRRRRRRTRPRRRVVGCGKEDTRDSEGATEQQARSICMRTLARVTCALPASKCDRSAAGLIRRTIGSGTRDASCHLMTSVLSAALISCRAMLLRFCPLVHDVIRRCSWSCSTAASACCSPRTCAQPTATAPPPSGCRSPG
jgi:hypothetical protein